MLLSNRKKLEESPYQLLPDATILDLLYSQNAEHFKEFLNQAGDKNIMRVLAKDTQYWINMLNESQISPRVILLGYPSAAYSKELLANETSRTSKQIESLGPENLKIAEMELDEAIESQVFPPNEVLASIPVANVSSITYRQLTYYNYTTIGGWEFGDSFTESIDDRISSLLDIKDDKVPSLFDIKDIPFRFHFDDINSQFIRIYLFLDMSNISPENRMYAVLLTQLWLDSPLRNGSAMTSLDEVLQHRSKEALYFYNDLGYKGSTFTPGSQSHLQMFHLEAKMEKYESVVSIIKEALFNVEFTISRAKTIVSQLLNRVPSKKQSASTVVNALYDNIYFNNNTFIHSASFLRQANFLRGTKNSFSIFTLVIPILLVALLVFVLVDSYRFQF